MKKLIAISAMGLALWLSACGDSGVDISTERGDPAPAAVTVVFNANLKKPDEGDKTFQIEVTQTFTNIEKLEYKTGGDLLIKGVISESVSPDKAWNVASLVGTNVQLKVDAPRIIALSVSDAE